MNADDFLILRDASAQLKVWFDSLIEAGFTESQAMSFMVGVVSTMTTPASEPES